MKEAISDIEERIKNLVSKRLKVYVKGKKISKDTPLLGKGLGLDSISLQELVVGLEEEFNVIIDESDLGIELFENIGSLANFINERLTND